MVLLLAEMESVKTKLFQNFHIYIYKYARDKKKNPS